RSPPPLPGWPRPHRLEAVFATDEHGWTRIKRIEPCPALSVLIRANPWLKNAFTQRRGADGDRRVRGGHGAGAVVGGEREPLGADERDLGDAHEGEHVAQVRLLEVRGVAVA